MTTPVASPNPIPTYTQPLVDGKNTSKAWYRFFQGLYQTFGSGTVTSVGIAPESTDIVVGTPNPVTTSGNIPIDLSAQVKADLALASTALQTLSVIDSVTGAGTVASPLQLSGDQASPGNLMLYGTNSSGSKGWFDQPSSGGSATFLNANVTPDTHPLNPTPRDDEFEESSLSGQWTWVNKTSDSVAFSGGALEYTGALNSSQATAFIAEPMSSTTAWRYRTKMRFLISAAYNNGGIILYESASGKSMEFGLLNNNGSPVIWVAVVPTPTTNSAATYSSINGAFAAGTGDSSDPIYFEVQLASGTLYFRYSVSGYDEDFVTFYSVAVGTNFTTAPDHVGIGGWSQNATVPVVLLVDWFRDYTNGYLPSVGTTPAIAPFNVTADTHTNTPTYPANDEFEYGTALDTTGNRFSGATPWSTVNATGASFPVVDGSLAFTVAGVNSGTNIILAVQPIVSGSAWRYRCKVSDYVMSNTNPYPFFGLAVYNSGNGAFLDIHYRYNPLMEVDRFTNVNTFASTIASWSNYLTAIAGGNGMASGVPIYFEIELNSGNLLFRWSGSGIDGTFIQEASEPVSNFLGAVTHIGLVVGQESNSNNNLVTCFDWFRRAA